MATIALVFFAAMLALVLVTSLRSTQKAPVLLRIERTPRRRRRYDA